MQRTNLKLVVNNKEPVVSQKEYDNHMSHLAWFAGGFMCALVALGWLVK